MISCVLGQQAASSGRKQNLFDETASLLVAMIETCFEFSQEQRTLKIHLTQPHHEGIVAWQYCSGSGDSRRLRRHCEGVIHSYRAHTDEEEQQCHSWANQKPRLASLDKTCGIAGSVSNPGKRILSEQIPIRDHSKMRIAFGNLLSGQTSVSTEDQSVRVYGRCF